MMRLLVPFCLWFGCPEPPPEPPPAPQAAVSQAPAPAPAADSTYRGMGSNWGQWEGLIAAYFPADQLPTALCVVEHESGGNPNAKNPTSGAAGLFQIMPFWWDAYGGDRYDLATNVALARVIWDGYGWGAWSAYARACA